MPYDALSIQVEVQGSTSAAPQAQSTVKPSIAVGNFF